MPTFYAVRIGRQPGVYTTTEEYLRQMEGFPYAKGKKFINEEDAWEYVNETEVEEDSRSSMQAAQRRMGMAMAGFPRPFDIYDDCVQDPSKFKQAKHFGAPCPCSVHDCDRGREMVISEMRQIKTALKRQMVILQETLMILAGRTEDMLGLEDGAIKGQMLPLGKKKAKEGEDDDESSAKRAKR